ncbi:MAG: OmpA family protein [Pseudomonadota bacterium]
MLRSTLALLFCFSTTAFADDVAGSEDHPLTGRWEGSHIVGYDVKDFDEVDVPFEAGDEGFRKLEGRVTRISYELPDAASGVAVMRGFEEALTEQGFAVAISCETDACGGISYDVDQFPIPRMIVDPFDYRYLTMTGTYDELQTTVTVLWSKDRLQIGVIEGEAFQTRVIPAEEISASVIETGRAAIYGIFFDTDAATIKPESAEAIGEVAAFLSAEPELDVIIVGHTDNVGSLEYNLGLSARRAQAVVDALTGQHGIAGDRLQHAGAAFLAPVAPNTSPVGRALNRRVEVIAQ